MRDMVSEKNEQMDRINPTIDLPTPQLRNVFKRTDDSSPMRNNQIFRSHIAMRQRVNSLHEKFTMRGTLVMFTSRAQENSDRSLLNVRLEGRKIQISAPSPVEKRSRSTSDSQGPTPMAKRTEIADLSKQNVDDRLPLYGGRSDEFPEPAKETPLSRLDIKGKMPQLLLDNERRTTYTSQIHTERAISQPSSRIASPIRTTRMTDRFKVDDERERCDFVAPVPSLSTKIIRLPAHFRRIARNSSNTPDGSPRMYAKRPETTLKILKNSTHSNHQSPTERDMTKRIEHLEATSGFMEGTDIKVHKSYTKNLNRYISRFEQVGTAADPHVKTAGEKRRRLFQSPAEKKTRWEALVTLKHQRRPDNIKYKLNELLDTRENSRSNIARVGVTPQNSVEIFERYTPDKFIPNI